MFSNPDLNRSYQQYKRHRELVYLKLNLLHQIFLSIVFILSIPFSFLSLFFKKCSFYTGVYFIKYSPQNQPYKTINAFLKDMNVDFITIEKLYFPVVPMIFIQDILLEFWKAPFSFLKMLPFLGGLILQVSKYYFFIKLHKVHSLVVMQEYSFYMSYLTRVMENEGGYLHNIMHGVPGETYCFFRFSKCFVWGEYFKEQYIKYRADEEQFIISGSLYHTAIQNQKLQEMSLPIDILYVMQGAHKKYKEVLKTLELLDKDYKVGVKQHPRLNIPLDTKIVELNTDTIECIKNADIVISHYSTALLDSMVLGKVSIAYIDKNSKEYDYVLYIDEDNIIENKEILKKKILSFMKSKQKKPRVEQKFLDMDRDTKKILIDEIYKGLK